MWLRATRPSALAGSAYNRVSSRFWNAVHQVLTGGGPGRETFMVVQNIYEVAFTANYPDYGQAAAGSVLMAVVIAVSLIGVG